MSDKPGQVVAFPPHAQVRALYVPLRELVQKSDLAPAAVIGVLEQVKFELLRDLQAELDE